jgi:hypothetical protein
VDPSHKAQSSQLRLVAPLCWRGVWGALRPQPEAQAEPTWRAPLVQVPVPVPVLVLVPVLGSLP